jgi:DNA-binding NarL/FixJ family response regulator
VKNYSLQKLQTAIKSLGGGASYVDPRVVAFLLRRSGANRSTNELSPREREIVRLIAQGLPNREIERRLVLSEQTIRKQVGRFGCEANPRF